MKKKLLKKQMKMEGKVDEVVSKDMMELMGKWEHVDKFDCHDVLFSNLCFALRFTTLHIDDPEELLSMLGMGLFRTSKILEQAREIRKQEKECEEK